MIKAGVYFLESKTSKSEKEILEMYYPDFKDRLDYYGDPEEYIKIKMDEEAVKDKIEDIKDKMNKFKR
ncbi:hypothetical protein [Methanobacterium sp.]|uniref:hypothetical protein n=1 Tax=Methanobacterium sp. TaxID=2164 RepID=UPI0031595C71